MKCCHEFSNEKEVVNFCMDNIKVEIPKIKNSIPSSHVEDMENRWSNKSDNKINKSVDDRCSF